MGKVLDLVVMVMVTVYAITGHSTPACRIGQLDEGLAVR
jgi:hypothetical protein